MADRQSYEFRFSFFTQKYRETVAFYKEILEFPVIKTWNRGFNDSGYLFEAASGLLVVLQSATKQVEPLVDAVLLVEVEDVDRQFKFCMDKNVPVTQKIVTREWGDRDFRISDPNGLIIGFYSRK